MSVESKKIALITGASRGLGNFCAKRFWDEGFNLLLVSSNKNQLDQAEKEFSKKNGQKLSTFACDLSNEDQVENLVKFFKENFSHLNVLLNNAAIQGPIGSLIDNDLDLWKKTLQINFYAPVFLIQALVPLMKNSENASIINISGGGATNARPNFSAYASSKSALVRFSECLSEELKESGIRVNCVAPGAMNTSMLAEVLKTGILSAGEKEVAIAKKVFNEGGASMEKVADLLIFLSSDKSRGITGKLISAIWDNWDNWPNHLDQLDSKDLYTLRRITARDRGLDWGDK
jgi:NAD(P)-dependent dehydrogenase (short-subunit alcohol dehydrogenase family)